MRTCVATAMGMRNPGGVMGYGVMAPPGVGYTDQDKAQLPAGNQAQLDALMAAIAAAGVTIDVAGSSLVPATGQTPPFLLVLAPDLNVYGSDANLLTTAQKLVNKTARGLGWTTSSPSLTDTVFLFPPPGKGIPGAAAGAAPAQSNTMLWVLAAVAAGGLGLLAARSSGQSRKNPANNDSELELYAWNTGELYDSRKAIIRYMKREMDHNNYDHGLGIERWRQWFLRAARMYTREIDRDTTFSAAEVREAAESVEHRVFGEIQRGEHASL